MCANIENEYGRERAETYISEVLIRATKGDDYAIVNARVRVGKELDLERTFGE